MNECQKTKIEYCETLLKTLFLCVCCIVIMFFTGLRVYADAPVVSTTAENGKMYADKADLIFAAKTTTAETYTYFKCVYTDASGESVCLEENVAKTDGSEAFITKSYSEEGIYDVDFFCTDSTGTSSQMLHTSIAVDSAAPEIIFENAENGKLYKDGFELGLTVKEMFYDLITVDIDATVTVDGSETKLIVPFDVQATANKNIYKFEGSGKYRLKVHAKDSNGHSSDKTIEFTVDNEPPKIEIRNEDMLLSGKTIVSKAPDFYVDVSDDLSGAKSAEIVLARKEGNVYSKIQTYKEFSKCVSLGSEGFYSLKITAVDNVGNKAEKILDITLDKTPPVIEYISDFNEKYLNSFVMPNNFKGYIKDLTDTVYKAYLNSRQINEGEVVKADGKYILQVVSEDMAGNCTEEMIAFIIDNVNPKIVVNGLDQSGKAQDGVIKLTLLDSDDYFESAVINGEDIQFDDDRKEINIKTDANESYEICVTAKDFAGNGTTETIKVKNALGAYDPKMSVKSVQTLTKNNSKNAGILSRINSGAGFWIFCGIAFVAAVIFIIFAVVDIKNLS